MGLYTNGWDLIYNIRFDKANTLITDEFITQFVKLETLNNELATAMAGGILSSITVRSVSAGQYSTITSGDSSGIKETQSPATATPATLGDVGTKGIANIEINSPVTNKSLDARKYVINGITNNAVAIVKLRLNSVNIINGGKYLTPPTISFTSDKGNGIKLDVTLDFLSGAINGFNVVDKGSGYHSPPIIQIIGGESSKDAVLELIMEPYVEVLQPGNATTAPTITITDNNSNTPNSYTTTVTMGYGSLISSGGVYANTFLLPPIVYSKGTLPANTQHPIFYTSFNFTNTSNITVTDVKASIKKCFGVGVKQIIKEIDNTVVISSWLDNSAYKPSTEPTGTTVKEYCLKIVDDFLTRLYESSKEYAESEVLKMIRKNTTYKANATVYNKDNIEKFERPAINLLKAYARFFPSTSIGDLPNNIPDVNTPERATYEATFTQYKEFLQTLIDHEKGLIKNRMVSNVLWIDNQIFYNLDGSEIPLSDFKLTENTQGFIESMIQIVKSLVSNLFHSSFKACTVENKNNASKNINLLTNTNRRYDRIKLITGPLQLRTGGNENSIKIDLPILKLVGILGEGSVVYDKITKGTDEIKTNLKTAYMLPLVLNASWVRAGFKSDHKSLVIDSVNIDLNDRDFDVVLKDIFSITNFESRTIVKNTIHSLINDEYAKYSYADINILKSFQNLYDVYLKTFDYLLMPYNAATKDSNLTWLLPTSYNISVEDEAIIPANIKNSVFSLCCMINGKPNNDAGYVDINAIPEGATSALVIERSVFAEYMVKAAFAKGNKLFDVTNETMSKSSAYSFSNSGEMTLKINSNEVTLNSSSGDVILNSNSGDVILNSNSGDVILNSNNGEVKLKINSGEVIIKIGNGSVIQNGVILTNNSGEVKLNSSSSEVKLNIYSSEVKLNSRSGEVKLNINSGEVKLKSNNGEVKLKSKDYLNSKNTGVEGTIPAEKLNISVEESSIKVAMSDVEYEYNSKNTPTINQEYIFNLEYQKPPTGKPDSIIKSTSKEKLFIIENNFKPNITGDWVLNTVGPFVKNILLEPVLKSLFDKRRGFQPTGFIKVENEKKKVESNQILQDPRSRNVSHLSNAINSNDSVNQQLNQNSFELQNFRDGNDEGAPLSGRDKRKAQDGNNKPNKINKVGPQKTKNAQSDEFELEYTLNSSLNIMYISLIIRKIRNIVQTIKSIDNVKDKVKLKKLSQAELQELQKQKKYIRHLIDCINNFEFGDNGITRKFCREYELQIMRQDRYQEGIYEKDVTYLGQLESPNEFKGYLFDPQNEVFKAIKNHDSQDLQEKVKQIIEKLKLLDKVRIENEVEHIPLTEIIGTCHEICKKLNLFLVLTTTWKL